MARILENPAVHTTLQDHLTAAPRFRSGIGTWVPARSVARSALRRVASPYGVDDLLLGKSISKRKTLKFFRGRHDVITT